MFSKYLIRCLIQHKCFKHERNEQKTNWFFQRKVSETTFLNDEDVDFQIHSNEEQTNHNAIDQTCVTLSCIPGESSSKVTLDSQPFHPASSFQFPKKKCGNWERPCQANWFQKFAWLHYDTKGWLGCLVLKEPLESVSDKSIDTCDKRVWFLLKFQVKCLQLCLN